MRLQQLWTSFLIEPLQRFDREQREFLASPESRRPDVKVIAVMLTAAIVLTIQHYYFRNGGMLPIYANWLDAIGLHDTASTFRNWFESPRSSHFAGWAEWALISFATYFFIPWLVIVLVFRRPLGEFGFKLRGAFQDWWVYIAFFAVMWPLLFWVSTHDHFQQTYPFYKLQTGESLWPYFWLWEALYFLQFIGLEFFFRGFMVHGTRHRFGVYSVFVMAVPYCMIHFQKPLLETCGAIIAGVVLGFMSLKTRSVALGAAIHMSVALSMDFLSMWRQERFFL
jgi:membrane protease YdiL (CAAX protease family)